MLILLARKNWLSVVCAITMIAFLHVGAKAVEGVRAVNFDDLNKAFRSGKHWNGADGAMSVDLGSSRTLWLFGDTWIKDSAADSTNRKMINNSVAIEQYMFDEKSERGLFDQEFSDSPDILHVGDLHWSYWFGKPDTPQSIFTSTEPGVWYWPGCGAIYDGKLFLILKKIRKKDDPNPLFQFDWFGEDLLVVENPLSTPNKWKYTRHPLGSENHNVQYGLACTTDKKYFYSLCYLQETTAAAKKTIMARIPLRCLADMQLSKWEYCCKSAGSPEAPWNADFRLAGNIIPDGGPEMSLFFENASKCFFAVYQPPFSPKVNLRVARKIEGPWSEPLTLWKIPQVRLYDGQSNAMLYAGKAHRHLTLPSGIGFTYCANPGGLEQHASNPEVYFPTARYQPITRQTVPNLLYSAAKRKPEE